MMGEVSWKLHPFAGPVTHVGVWRGGYASVWFPGGKIKVIPAESGLKMTVQDYPHGPTRIPYQKNKKGKTTHISKTWMATGLGVANIHPDGFHALAQSGMAMCKYRAVPNGVEFQAADGTTASLKCNFTVSKPPDVQIAVLPGDVHDNMCNNCHRRSAPKRCLGKRCGACCTIATCKAHIHDIKKSSAAAKIRKGGRGRGERQKRGRGWRGGRGTYMSK
jgi:hypothetical protein